MKVRLISLGCPKNLVDSELLLGSLKMSGIELTESTPEADIIIINTCGFIEPAKRESIETILDAVSTGKRVIVVGCLVERYREELIKELPEVEAFFPTNTERRVLKYLGLNGTYRSFRLLTTPQSYAYLKISEGCNRLCSFCAIPSIRGRHRSRSIGDILQEAEYLAERGVKEIVMVSQDTTYYGKDLGLRNGILQLLSKLEKIEGVKWIRLLYLYPTEISGDLIEFIGESDKVVPYFDIPFQHISDRVLESMRRGYKGKFVRDVIERIRNRIPQAVLRSTFIVGYPCETNEDFEELRNFIEEGHFHWAGFFEYSQEDGTHAYGLGDPLSQEIKRERINILSEIQERVMDAHNREIRGKREVLVDGVESGMVVGRIWEQSPEIDGITVIEGKMLKYRPGDTVKVRIYDSAGPDLISRIDS